MSDLIFYRQIVSVFNIGFFSDALSTTPVVPINSDYPKYSIKNPSGVEVFSGVGSPSVGAGYWKAQIIIDDQNELTSPDERYSIEWTMVNSSNQQYSITERFELFDNLVSEPENREQKYIVMVGSDARLRLTMDMIPDDLNISVYQGMDQQNPIFSAPKTSLTRIKDGNSHVFYIDMPANLIGINQKYSVVWKFRRSVFDNEQYAYQVITAIGSYTLNLIQSVRMLIDKFQKRLGTVQAYEDSDIVEYLERGMELLNAQFPLTGFSVGNTPGALNVFHVMLSSWWALNAQQLLETDLGFNFCIDENTLIPTTNGLIRAKELLEYENPTHKLYSHTRKAELCILNEINELELTNKVYLRDIIDVLPSKPKLLSLASKLGRLKMSSLKESDGKGGYLWDFSNLEEVLNNFGYNEPYIPNQELESILTPFGYEKPIAVYKLYEKPCLRVETKLGYPVVATYNHPFLVLDIETFDMVWKKAEELKIGDLLAIQPLIPNFGNTTDISEYSNLINNDSSLYHDESVLPNTLTPDLGRILGYLIAEGDVTSDYYTTFFNTNKILLDDYTKCLRNTFKDLNIIEETKPNSGSFTDNDITTISFNSSKVRRLMYLLGLEYKKSYYKSIPRSIFLAPKEVVVQFIKGFVEGDGCISTSKKVDRYGYEYTSTTISLMSASENLMVDFQNLFLMFGIISTLTRQKNLWKVSISGKQLIKYQNEIGFLYKGSSLGDLSKTKYRSQKEAMPEILFAIKKNLRSLLKLDSQGKLDDSNKRYSISWLHSAKGTKHVTWDQINSWFINRSETIMELSPEIHERIRLLLETRYIWKPIKSITQAGNRTVIDPSFKSVSHKLSHSFVSGGLITHNTGQSITLDYDHAGQLSDVMGRWKEYIDNNLSVAKTHVLNQQGSVGTSAGRGYRYTQTMTWKVASYGTTGQVSPNSLMGQMNTLGLLW